MLRRMFQIVGVILVLMVAFVNLGGSLWVCTSCGCTSHTTDFLMSPVFRTMKETTFSATAHELGFAHEHMHQWSYGCGGGFGYCSLGHGRELFNAVTRAETAQFLRNTARFRGDEEAQRWFQISLDYRNSPAIPRWLQLNYFPDGGFESADDYEAFRTRADPHWESYVEANARNWGTNAAPAAALALIPK
jgi:hypothetical protein